MSCFFLALCKVQGVELCLWTRQLSPPASPRCCASCCTRRLCGLSPAFLCSCEGGLLWLPFFSALPSAAGRWPRCVSVETLMNVVSWSILCCCDNSLDLLVHNQVCLTHGSDSGGCQVQGGDAGLWPGPHAVPPVGSKLKSNRGERTGWTFFCFCNRSFLIFTQSCGNDVNP